MISFNALLHNPSGNVVGMQYSPPSSSELPLLDDDVDATCVPY